MTNSQATASDTSRLDELNDQCTAARKEMADVDKRLSQVLDELSRVAQKWLKTEAMLSTDPVGTLVDHASANGARWSGGPNTCSNIMESVIRAAAIGLMKSDPKWRSGGSR